MTMRAGLQESKAVQGVTYMHTGVTHAAPIQSINKGAQTVLMHVAVRVGARDVNC